VSIDLEERLSNVERELQAIPDLIDVRFRLFESHVARLSADMSQVKRAISTLSAQVDALPGTIARILKKNGKAGS